MFILQYNTGYTLGRQWGIIRFTSSMWVLRLVYLESIAGVPGMMFALQRHLRSCRRLERDRGWIRTLLEEAENERLHLLTCLYLYKPGKAFRTLVVIGQGVMANMFFIAYLMSPRFCHRVVGYLEEEAVKTYTKLVEDIDAGKYPEFNERASNLSRKYWRLSSNAVWRDVFMNIRRDESEHRDVNHVLANISNEENAVNPFRGK